MNTAIQPWLSLPPAVEQTASRYVLIGRARVGVDVDDPELLRVGPSRSTEKVRAVALIVPDFVGTVLERDGL